MSSHEIQEPQSTEVAGFIAKTFQILNNDQFSKIAYWASSGTEFIIKDTNKFQSIVLPRYFRHNKMNSFIRQLNMYGFHKSRADHSKSVFSHPDFLRGRGYHLILFRDLLMHIKRKIKGKNDQKNDGIMETPTKKRSDIELQPTTTKKIVETGHQLRSQQQMVDLSHNVSFNLLGTKEKLNSLMNINFTINKFPLAELGALNYDHRDDSDSVSIADKIDAEECRKEFKQTGSSFKFINPSCFFDSMKKSL